MQAKSKFSLRGLGSTAAVGYDVNGNPLDINGNVITNIAPVTLVPPGTDLGASIANFLTPLATGASQYLTAQQTNQGINTMSNVAMAAIVVWGAVKIFGK